MDNKRAQKAIEIVAKRHGVPVEEVRAQIEDAMTEARKNTQNGPAAQKHWQSIPCSNGVMTPEDLIAYIANTVEGSKEKA